MQARACPPGVVQQHRGQKLDWLLQTLSNSALLLILLSHRFVLFASTFGWAHPCLEGVFTLAMKIRRNEWPIAAPFRWRIGRPLWGLHRAVGFFGDTKDPEQFRLKSQVDGIWQGLNREGREWLFYVQVDGGQVDVPWTADDWPGSGWSNENPERSVHLITAMHVRVKPTF